MPLNDEMELTTRPSHLYFILPRDPLLSIAQFFYTNSFQGFLRSVVFNYFSIFASMPQKPIRMRRLEAPALELEHRKLMDVLTETPASSLKNQLDSKGRPKCQRGFVVSFGICLNCGKPCKWKCSGCFVAYYCDRSCQKKNWKDHKVFCKKNRRTSAGSQQNGGSGDDSGSGGNSGDTNLNQTEAGGVIVDYVVVNEEGDVIHDSEQNSTSG
jgi:hypothetical protein